MASSIPQPPNIVYRIENEVYERITRLFVNNELIEKIDRIPYEMRPLNHDSESTLCCIYKDRAIIRYRVIAALGFRIEDETDDFRSLASYAEEALKRTPKDLQKPVLTVLEAACHECAKPEYYVTDACQRCTARYCAQACAKKAISHIDRKAHIDPAKCVRCGKCHAACPYNAIIFRPIPCIKACPVRAITRDSTTGRNVFDWDKCIQCASCIRNCPFGAIMPRSQILDVLMAIKDKSQKVVAMLAPAVVGHFGMKVEIPAIMDALKKCGFDEVLEVSLGGDETAIREAEEFKERMEEAAKDPKHRQFMTTSCCPAYVACIRKHVPEIEDAISNTGTPMHYTSLMAKKRWPGCTTVFIGPCNAKLAETIDDPDVDLCINFYESYSIICGNGITIDEKIKTFPPEAEQEPENFKPHVEGRGFPVIGGVAAAVASFLGDPAKQEHPVRPVVIDGLNPDSVKKLKSFAKVNPPGNIVEVMACRGGCIAGPGAPVSVQMATARVKMVTKKSKVHPEGTAKFPFAPVIITGDHVYNPSDPTSIVSPVHPPHYNAL